MHDGLLRLMKPHTARLGLFLLPLILTTSEFRCEPAPRRCAGSSGGGGGGRCRVGGGAARGRLVARRARQRSHGRAGRARRAPVRGPRRGAQRGVIPRQPRSAGGRRGGRGGARVGVGSRVRVDWHGGAGGRVREAPGSSSGDRRAAACCGLASVARPGGGRAGAGKGASPAGSAVLCENMHDRFHCISLAAPAPRCGSITRMGWGGGLSVCQEGVCVYRLLSRMPQSVPRWGKFHSSS